LKPEWSVDFIKTPQLQLNMQSKRTIKIFVVLAVLALAGHFTFVLIYSFRDFVPPKVQHLSDRYMVPCFHQNWKLFAPDLPKYNAELEYRFAKSSVWSDWFDVSAHSGFDKRSKIETVEQGFNSSLSWQIQNNYYSVEGRPQFDRLVSSPSYADALFMTLKMHQLKYGEKPDSVQIRMNFRFTPAPDQARNFQFTYLEFPIYKPEDQ
jgi:hypothetical protein